MLTLAKDEQIICAPLLSLPPRGAWIEIPYAEPGTHEGRTSLPPRGAWIEILAEQESRLQLYGRSPHGERGLKFDDGVLITGQGEVAPPTGSVD